jgi:hypothetical protein
MRDAAIMAAPTRDTPRPPRGTTRAAARRCAIPVEEVTSARRAVSVRAATLADGCASTAEAGATLCWRPEAAALVDVSISPHAAIMTSKLVSPLRDPQASTAFMTFQPSTTWPNTTCLPSRKGVAATQMKNWDPFVFWWRAGRVRSEQRSVAGLTKAHRASISHGQDAHARVPQLKVLVSEAGAVNASPARAVVRPVGKK